MCLLRCHHLRHIPGTAGAQAQVIEEVIANESASWQDHLCELLSQLFEAGERRGFFAVHSPENVASENPADEKGRADLGQVCFAPGVPAVSLTKYTLKVYHIRRAGRCCRPARFFRAPGLM